MSWNIKVIGKKEIVRERIQEDKHIPESVKTVILDHIQNEPDEYHNAVRVEGFGHKYTGTGSYVSGISQLQIEPIMVLFPEPNITPVNESNLPADAE